MYNGIEELVKDAPRLLPRNKVNICMYQITTNELPFLLFSLQKTDESILEFPHYIHSEQNANDIITDISKHIYNGYIQYNGETYMFYQIKTDYVVSFMNRDAIIWKVLASEIVNEQKVLTFDIARNVVDSPIAGYYGSDRKRIKYIIDMGHERENPNAILGPYYYFGTYSRAMRYVFWSSNWKPVIINDEHITDENGKFNEGGLVRFALFLGNHTIDIEDKNWNEKYDSIILTRKKKNDRVLEPQYILKKYNQQFTLSYHDVDTNVEVDKNNLGILEIM